MLKIESKWICREKNNKKENSQETSYNLFNFLKKNNEKGNEQSPLHK